MTSKKNMSTNRTPRRIDRTAGGRNKKAKPTKTINKRKSKYPEYNNWPPLS